MAPAWAAEPLKVGFMTVSSGALAAGGRQLFDEPSEGLAPQIVTEVAAVLRRLHESGLSIVLVEQNIKLALEIADEVVVLNTGYVAHAGAADSLRTDSQRVQQLLGVY
jgi:branched-chain amino acid transport system ATP-binding protein